MKVRSSVLLALVSCCIGVGSIFVVPDLFFYRERMPIRMWRNNSGQFESCAKLVLSGDCLLRTDGQGVVVPPHLRDLGVTYIFRDDILVRFVFSTAPSDPHELLIYADHELSVSTIQTCLRRRTIYHYEWLSSHWCYCRHDLSSVDGD